ncbi:MAG: hypothetical protein R3B13_40415 [Polyangiaceae bacterium]
MVIAPFSSAGGAARGAAARRVGVALAAAVLFVGLACDRARPAAPSSDGPAPSVAPTLSVAPPAATPPSPAPTASSLPAPAEPATRVTSRDGQLELISTPVQAIHTHGGDAAKLGRFRLSAVNRGGRSRRLKFEGVTYLTGHSCQEAPKHVSARPKPQLLVNDGDEDPRAGGLEVTLVAGEQVLSAQFDSVEAYYTHCDQFAFVGRFSVDGRESMDLLVKIEVTREEP